MSEPGRDAWKAPRVGQCAVCGTWGRLVRHHIVTEQTIRREGGDPYDLRNALALGSPFVCQCHAAHHAMSRRIPMRVVPDAALEFAVELLGRDRAALYFASHYEGERA